MRWNKEKVVFAAALALSVVAAGIAFRSATSARESGAFDECAPARHEAIRMDESPQWVRLEAPKTDRNPFEAVSAWRGAPRDPLPAPDLSELDRRVPLPSVVGRVESAQVPREAKKPEEVK